MFYLSCREGYGTLYLKTSLFQGLYKADRRFGPGIETYPDGSQDVGLWFREHLIKLCTEVPGSFSMSNFPEFSGFLTRCPARISLSDEEKMEWALHEEQDPFFYDYKQFLLNDDVTLPPEMYIYSTDSSHLPMTRSFCEDLDARVFLDDTPPLAEDGQPWLIQNETPLMVRIQKQTYKFRNKKAHNDWNMGAILAGNRSSFARCGPKERLSQEMILRAEEGACDWIHGVLRENLASPDVADAKGYTVLAAATVHGHTDIISLLLDSGADVNKCSDEGLTPLSMSFLLHYPARSFKPNIAERTAAESQVGPAPVAGRRNRWLTIRLLLRRGADPNLCHVPMQVLFFAVKAGDVEGVKLLLQEGARADTELPAELGSLTPLHIAAALPGEEGVQITELLLHAITDVDARAADQDDVYKWDQVHCPAAVGCGTLAPGVSVDSVTLLVQNFPSVLPVPEELDLLPSSLKLSGETGPPSIYYTECTSAPNEGGRTALHMACEREDNYGCARDVVRLLLSHKADPTMLWSGHSPLSLSIASGNDLIVKELLSHGADPNLHLTRGLGSALCIACDISYEHRRSMESKLALIDRLIDYGADILSPVTLTQGNKVAVGTAVDYGYFRFYQDRKIAHCPFHVLMPAERETFLARKRLLDHMGFQLRRAVLSKESQWDPKALYLSKRALTFCRNPRRTGTGQPKEPQAEPERVPFFKFCYQCGRSVGVRLVPCTRCYGILTCSKTCRTRAWADFHGRDCGALMAAGKMYGAPFTENSRKPLRPLGRAASRKPEIRKGPHPPKCFHSTYKQE
ncbi:ankyrin repeat and MYND domain-containing protein 1 isoform X2 [Manis pentadactyla]|uniref:ankyrin repeat and MYND domain-containing protein 1 isoform X2 n=1 Tax=Manis pentadactyla TaxID=143292 RepID=UPI00255CD07F|nr:ankyrin repeat and MYND domain-containing protein 1 isoform X2 [Manis pentadactyla]